MRIKQGCRIRYLLTVFGLQSNSLTNGVSNEENIQETQIKENTSGRQVCGLGFLQSYGFNRTEGFQLWFAPSLQFRGIVD